MITRIQVEPLKSQSETDHKFVEVNPEKDSVSTKRSIKKVIYW